MTRELIEPCHGAQADHSSKSLKKEPYLLGSRSSVRGQARAGCGARPDRTCAAAHVQVLRRMSAACARWKTVARHTAPARHAAARSVRRRRQRWQHRQRCGSPKLAPNSAHLEGVENPTRDTKPDKGFETRQTKGGGGGGGRGGGAAAGLYPSPCGRPRCCSLRWRQGYLSCICWASARSVSFLPVIYLSIYLSYL